MKVKIINFTQKPERLIYNAAKICFGKNEEFDFLSKDEINEFIKRLYYRGHLSVFEHVSFTFEISGISRACSHQLVRHRIASYTQESQRYVFNGYFEEEDYVIPKKIKENPELKEKFIEKLKEIHEFYKDLVTLYGLPIEDARYILPNALTTKIIMTMNVRELIHFIKLRTCRRAQAEIRELAFEIKKELSNVLEIFKIVFPDCDNCLDDCSSK